MKYRLKTLNIGKALKEDLGLSLGERMTVYSGAALGFVAPMVYNRYVGFGDAQGDPAREAFYWAGAVVTAIPLSILGGVVGGVAGLSASVVHKMHKDEKRFEDVKANLETKVKGLFEK